MSKNITINKEEFKVLNDEFNKVHHNEFNNLNILSNLGLYERIVSLIKELSFLFTKPNIHMINISHGGYVPIKCSAEYNNITIKDTPNDQLDNIKHNAYLHKIKNILYSSNKSYNYNVQTNVIFIDGDIQINVKPDNCIIILKNNLNHKNTYKIKNSEYNIYIPENIIKKFLKRFEYFIEVDNILNYDNLIHYAMIVKNAGNDFEEILKKNLPIIDRWTILDTGSTDNTIHIIKKTLYGKKKGKVYQEPFINFRDSRNRCLDLVGNSCKFVIILDDTYIIDGNLREFLNTVRGDQYSDSFSLFIRSNDMCYNSNRIIKTDSRLRYIYKIHEVINPRNNINVIIPYHHSNIFDVRSDYMEKRTMDRKLYDIEILLEEVKENPKDPRALYYLGQTYNLLNKYELSLEYYMKRVNHENEGFLQEKIDACFEAARTSNFKLNKPWEECKFLYEKSFEMDKTRSDSLYFMGIHYYMEFEKGIDIQNNINICYQYMKTCFDLGYPEHCQYSLKPSLHFYFLPKFLAHISYIKNDYITGLKCCERFLEKNKSYLDGVIPFKECFNELDYKTMKSWYDIFKMCMLIPSTNLLINSYNKPLLVFMADGGFNKWTGRDILDKGMGGSETFTIEISKHIEKMGNFHVIVFCVCKEDDIYEGVEYKNLSEFTSFIYQNEVHTCVIGRYSEYLPLVIKSNVENIHMIAHDLDFTGNVIPRHEKLKTIFCLSDWHTEHFSTMYPSLKYITKTFGYGIDSIDLKDKDIDKLVFIYSSFPIRGLLPLLQMWPQIVNRYPNVLLHIHCDIDGWWSNKHRPDEMQKIKSLLKEYLEDSNMKNTLVYHGWTSKKDLQNSWKDADIWFYPCTFKETFCHTALEAAISKTFIITTELAGLKNTVDDRGVLLNGDFYDTTFQNIAVQILFEYIDNKKLRDKMIENNYDWVMNMSWENRAKEFMKYLIPDSKKFNMINSYFISRFPDKIVNTLMIGGKNFNSVLDNVSNSKLVTFNNNLDVSSEYKDRLIILNTDISKTIINFLKSDILFDFIYLDLYHINQYERLLFLNISINILKKNKLMLITKINNKLPEFIDKYKEDINIIYEDSKLILIEKI